MNLPAYHELPAELRAEQRALIVSRVAGASHTRRVAAVILAAAVLVATPALALHRQVVDFFSSEPAPERIQKDFDMLNRVRVEAPPPPPGIPPPPHISPVGQAREVMTVNVEGIPRPLWVVPNEGGGFCYRWHFMGSCGGLPGSTEAKMKIGGGGLSNGDGVEGLALVWGRVLASEIEEVELLYQDGERATLPFVWVSDPIDAGFYAYEVPEEHRRPGRLTVAVIGLDEDGQEVARQCLPLSPDELARSVPAVASACARPRR
jgi:hypothetical protein